MPARRSPFDVKRSGEKIELHGIKHSVKTDIEYSNEFALFDAAIAAGATLTELDMLIRGEFSQKLMARVLVWHKYKQLIEVNTQDAVARASERKR